MIPEFVSVVDSEMFCNVLWIGTPVSANVILSNKYVPVVDDLWILFGGWEVTPISRFEDAFERGLLCIGSHYYFLPRWMPSHALFYTTS